MIKEAAIILILRLLGRASWRQVVYIGLKLRISMVYEVLAKVPILTPEFRTQILIQIKRLTLTKSIFLPG